MGSLLKHLYVGDGGNGFVGFVHFGVLDKLWMAYDYATGVEIVVQRLALTQKLGREQEVELLESTLCILDVQAAGIAYGDGRLDYHYGIWIDLKHEVDNLLYMTGVKIVLNRVVVGRRRNHHKVGIGVCCLAVEGGCKVELFLGEILLYIFVLYRRDSLVELVHLLWYDVNSRNMVVLRHQYGYAQTHVAGSGNGNLYVFEITHNAVGLVVLYFIGVL